MLVLYMDVRQIVLLVVHKLHVDDESIEHGNCRHVPFLFRFMPICVFSGIIVRGDGLVNNFGARREDIAVNAMVRPRDNGRGAVSAVTGQFSALHLANVFGRLYRIFVCLLGRRRDDALLHRGLSLAQEAANYPGDGRAHVVWGRR